MTIMNKIDKVQERYDRLLKVSTHSIKTDLMVAFKKVGYGHITKQDLINVMNDCERYNKLVYKI